MCLVTRQRKPKILKKDLKVYKVLREGSRSKYQNFLWEPEISHKEIIHITDNKKWDRFQFCDDKTMDKYYKLSGCIEIDKGFHACCTKERAEGLSADPRYSCIKEEVYAFLIPKGSEVYYDCTGLIVANQMMML